MNEVQRNFKKQMAEIEKDLQDKEARGEGQFTNNLYKDKFYGAKSSSRKGLRNTIIVILIIGAVLFITNPTKADFNDWAKTQLYKQSKTDIEREAVAVFGTWAVDAMTVRKSYFFFSIYEVNQGDGSTKKVLGVLKFFKEF